MSEIKTPLEEVILNYGQELGYIIRPRNSVADVLRHLVEEVGIDEVVDTLYIINNEEDIMKKELEYRNDNVR